MAKIKSYEEKVHRIDPCIQGKKILLIGKKKCEEIAVEAINKEYRKIIKKNINIKH